MTILGANDMAMKKTRTINKKRGQNIIEYAIIISVVATALMVMYLYVQRATQANLKILEEKLVQTNVAGSFHSFESTSYLVE